MNKGKYNIKAVSALTGIQPGTLRAWERRYDILEPVRNPAGHRLYTDEHIHKLKWLAEKVQKGLTISQAAALLEQQEAKPGQDFMPDIEFGRQEELFEQLLQALLQFDEAKAQELINKAFALFTIDKAAVDILASLLVRIGNLAEAEEITAAHEHFAASILRARLGMVMHSFPCNGVLPKVVAVCGLGELQEPGLLIFALFAKRLGYDVIYLGKGLQEKDIFTVTETVEPKFLFFSCTARKNAERTAHLANKLKKRYPQMEIGIGGTGLVGALSDGTKTFFAGSKQVEWEHWLNSRL